MPVLHLLEDLEPEGAAKYARSVEAAWICYPTSEGVKLASVGAGIGFEAVRIEDVAGRVLGAVSR